MIYKFEEITMRFICILIMMMLISACTNTEPQIIVSESAQKVSLAVGNMTCSTCGPTVRRALQKVKGVYRADVNTQTHSAIIYFDANLTSPTTLIQATTQAGYPSKVAL